MQVDLIDIDKVIPYARNPRRNESAIDKVSSSIKEFGFRVPVVVDKDFVLIAGHTRLQAAKKLGLKKIPVHKAENLSEAQVKAYRLADNRVAQESEWDNELLSLELKDLQGVDFNLLLTGFNESEINLLLNPENLTEGIIDEDFCGEFSEDNVSVLGDIWILGSHRLMCGDSTNPQHFEQLTKNESINLMVTDPPYGVDYDPSWREECDLGLGKRSKGKVQNDDKAEWTDAYSLFNGNIAYVWHAAKYTHIVAKNLEDCGFKIAAQIIWAKQHFALSRGDYHWQHEPCWYVVRHGEKHNWQGARNQSTLWEIKNNNAFGNSEKEKTWGHGTQKPVECMLRPILNNSKPNDSVYDPFGGSGTTLIAAEKSNRKCFMMELDAKYCDLIIRRWQDFTGKKAILENNGKTFEELEKNRKL